MGFRVPMLVLSPFSRGGHVASEVFDHTSQLRFLEERFGVKAPNISAWRRHTAGDLTSTLHMGRADRRCPRCPARPTTRWRTWPPWAAPRLDILDLNTDLPRYPVPLHQSMPRQEASSG